MKAIKSITAICLSAMLLAGCSQSKTHPFFDEGVSKDTYTEGTSIVEEQVPETSVPITTEDTPESTPKEDAVISTFFNTSTHPELFYIKSTGFDYTRKTDEIKAIITEGYITEGDKITGCYMLIYPMLGFSSVKFDSYTAGLYSFDDFTVQDDSSYRLDITGDVLTNIQSLSASTSMAMLAGKAVAEGLTILDENGNLYTVYNGNLVLLTEEGIQGIPEADSSSEVTN